MAKQTLLEIVQDILSDSDGDEVNSINDTIEATQCAIIVRDVYSDIVDIHDLDSIRTLIELDATGASTPNVMTRPEGVHSIEFIKYDKKLDVADGSSYQYVDYLEPAAFLDRVHGLDTTDSNVQEVTLSTGHPIPVRNDVHPTYYTVMDVGSDELVFDSFNSDLETNLQQSKSLAYAMSKPTLTLADSSTIDLPKHLEVLVKRSARSMYFDLYKDGITAEVDRTRRRAEVRAQRQRHIVKNSDNNNAPDYGRK